MTARSRRIAPLLGLGLPLLAGAQGLSPAPPAEVHDLTPEPGFFSEPSIAINPRDPRQVVAAFQDNAHISFSTDSGGHWQAATGIEPPNYRVSGDVSVTFDNRGHAILCYMAFDRLGRFNYWAYGATRSGLFVRRTLDGGAAWETNHIPIIEHPSEPGIPWEDKPYIVADDTNGPYGGNLYVGWTRWTLTDSQIRLSRSTDGGPTWSAPVEINGKRGLPRDDNGALEGFAGAVGSDGTLYAVWSGTSTLAVHVVARWRPDVRSRARHPADRAHDVSTTGLFARQRVSADCGGPARRQVRAGVRDLERLPQWWRGCVLRDIRR